MSDKVACKCGRTVLTDEVGMKPHRVGKAHPGFPGVKREKRKETWCPEAKEPEAHAATLAEAQRIAKEEAEKAKTEAVTESKSEANDAPKSDDVTEAPKSN